MFEDSYEFKALRENRGLLSGSVLGALAEGVGRSQKNRREDVARVEVLMERNHDYDLERTQGPTGIFSTGLEAAVKDFQGRRGLTIDGVLLPRGETITALSGNKTPPLPERKPPVPQEAKKRDCSDLKFAYEHVKAQLNSKEMLLNSARKSLKILKDELAQLKEQLVKETDLLKRRMFNLKL